MQEFSLVKEFIKQKFSLNNMSYVNFNTSAMMASLMTESFQFSPEYSHLSAIENFVVGESGYHEIQGPIEAVCVDKNRTMLGEIDGILYLFERFQHMVKVSNDKGQNWQYVQLFNDRVGNPVSRVVIYQSKTTSYVLGYDKIFYGRKSSDVRWSSNEVKFSDNEVTFAKLKGIYVYQEDTNTWKRVFGNTDEEKRRIEHLWTSMSTDGKEIFFSSANFKTTEYAQDIELETKYPELISTAVKNVNPIQYHSDKHYQKELKTHISSCLNFFITKTSKSILSQRTLPNMTLLLKAQIFLTI